MSERIISDAGIHGGKPIIRGSRISVEIVLEWIASGASREDILAKYPHLVSEDIDQTIGYAIAAVGQSHFSASLSE